MGALGNVVYLNSVLLIYCSAVNSAMGIVSQVFDERDYLNLGNISLFVIYLASGINNLIAPTYVKKIQYKYIFVLSSLGYLFFLSEGILVCSCNDEYTYFYCRKPVIYSIIVLGSAICGFLSSILYICQNEYTSENTNEQNKSLYFGIAWALLQSSYIVGNVYSMFFIEPLGQFGYFLLMTGIASVTSLFFLFIQKPPKKQQILDSDQVPINQGSQSLIEKNENEQQYRQILPADDQQQDFYSLPLGQQLKSMFNIMSQPDIRPLLFFMFSSGIIMSFGFGVLYRIVQDSLSSDLTDEQVNKKTFTVNIVLGCFEFFGGAFVTPLADRLNKKRIAISTNLLFEAAIIGSIIAHYEKNYLLCFFVAALWGMTDCTTQSMNCNLISTKFGNDVRIFGIWNLVQCVGAFIGMIFSIIFKQLNIIYYLLVVAAIQMITNVALSNFKLKNMSQSDKFHSE
ncbi:hypothetical protein ABPG72_013906 [Tetrahymena utriculariae]